MDESNANVLASSSTDAVRRSQTRLFAAYAALARTQDQIDESRRRVRQSRELITTAEQLIAPAAHPFQSRQGFLPLELAFAA